MEEARREAQDLCLRSMNAGLIRRQVCTPVVVTGIQMSRRPFPPDDGLAMPIAALRAQCRAEGFCINCDHPGSGRAHREWSRLGTPDPAQAGLHPMRVISLKVL
jgi:hypothetical protein